MALEDLEHFYPKSRQEWRNWLYKNHLTSPGIWVIYYKKNIKKPTISYDDAVEEALSFGWIDSKVNSLDEERYMQIFTPRKSGSTWSKLNKDRIAKLMKEGLIESRGLEVVAEAKNDGSWNILDDVEALIVPKDLIDALKSTNNTENFNNYPDSVKKQILWWLKSAKRKSTRKNRIKKIIEAATKNERPN